MRAFILVALTATLACSSSDDGSSAAGAGGSGAAGGSGGAGGSSGVGASSSGGTAGSAPDAAADSPVPEPCQPVLGASYQSLPTSGPVTDRPAAEHGDLNLELRGWSPTGGTLGLIDVAGPTDALAPKLNTLFSDDRVPGFALNYRVNDWDWSKNQRGGPIAAWEVTLVGMQTSPGELLELPQSGYDIGNGLQARVLYADSDSVTLKYTAEDNVVSGYTIHVQGLCVEETLLSLYEQKNQAGRSELPALAGGQAFGRARTTETLVAIRDTGAFMDPRVKKDWW